MKKMGKIMRGKDEQQNMQGYNLSHFMNGYLLQDVQKKKVVFNGGTESVVFCICSTFLTRASTILILQREQITFERDKHGV